ncbi:MAG: hypothetical protein AB7G15_05820 [Alphaproteobacteria bacterium]
MAKKPKEVKIYAKSMVRRWRREIKNSEVAPLVLSPYLTGRVAEDILTASSILGLTPIIGTLFEAEVFANGSSEIRIFRQLLKIGCKLYHVPNLHAKCILTEHFYSIGSQNLTSRGSALNRELSIAVTYSTSSSVLRSQVNAWINSGIPIDTEMIEDMAHLIAPMRRISGKLKRHVANVDAEITKRAALRNEAKQRQEELRRKNDEQQVINHQYLREGEVAATTLRESLMRTRRSASKIIQLTDLRWETLWSSGTYTTMKLRSTQNHSLLEWKIGDQEIDLKKGKPYLLIFENVGRLSMMFPNKIQTNKFAREIYFNGSFKFGDKSWSLSYEFATDLKDISTWNVLFRFVPFPGVQPKRRDILQQCARLEAKYYFDVGSLRFVSSQIYMESEEFFQQLTRVLRSDDKGHLSTLRNLIIDPRNRGWHVWFEHPDQLYFGGAKYPTRLRAHLIDDSPCIVAKFVNFTSRAKSN